MSKTKKWILCISLQFIAISSIAAIYERQGFSFINSNGIYNTSMRIDGQFETSVDIHGIPLQDISPLVTSFTFSDGVQTLTESNSEIIRFSVQTNSNGNIGGYDIAVWRTPITNTVGEIVNGIELSLLPTNFPVSLLNEFGFQEPCVVSGLTQCAEISLINDFGQYIDGGGISPIVVPGWNYVSSTPPTSGPSPIAVETSGSLTLFILSLLIIVSIPYYRKH